MANQTTDLLSPAGTRIVATRERLSGRALIVRGSASRSGPAAVEFEYEGPTEIDWDAQETVVRDGHRVFLDVNGREFLEHELAVGNPAAGQVLTEEAP